MTESPCRALGDEGMMQPAGGFYPILAVQPEWVKEGEPMGSGLAFQVPATEHGAASGEKV
jgi:hypothetical protein